MKCFHVDNLYIIGNKKFNGNMNLCKQTDSQPPPGLYMRAFMGAYFQFPCHVYAVLTKGVHWPIPIQQGKLEPTTGWKHVSIIKCLNEHVFHISICKQTSTPFLNTLGNKLSSILYLMSLRGYTGFVEQKTRYKNAQ